MRLFFCGKDIIASLRLCLVGIIFGCGVSHLPAPTASSATAAALVSCRETPTHLELLFVCQPLPMQNSSLSKLCPALPFMQALLSKVVAGGSRYVRASEGPVLLRAAPWGCTESASLSRWGAIWLATRRDVIRSLSHGAGRAPRSNDGAVWAGQTTSSQSLCPRWLTPVNVPMGLLGSACGLPCPIHGGDTWVRSGFVGILVMHLVMMVKRMKGQVARVARI